MVMLMAAKGLGDADSILLTFFFGAAFVFVSWLILRTFYRLIPVVLRVLMAGGGAVLIYHNLADGLAWLTGLALIGLAGWKSVGRVRDVREHGVGD
jgi:hypothetical protein